MFLQRIVGTRGTGKTWQSLGQLHENAPKQTTSLYVARSMQEADRCEHLFMKTWGGGQFKRGEIEMLFGRRIRFVAPCVNLTGYRFGDVMIDAPLSTLGIRWLDHLLATVLISEPTVTFTTVAEPAQWARDMRAWLIFRRQCASDFGRTMLLTVCHSQNRVTQTKVPLIVGQRRPFMPSIWLPGTPEVGCKPDPIAPRPRLSSAQRYRQMMRELREASR